jgi:hypothetical protein
VTNEDCEPPAKEPKDMCEMSDDDNELNDDELDRSLNEKVITSSSEALKVVERLAEFAQFRGLEELSNAIFNVNDILMAIVCVSLKSKLVLIPILYDCERRTHFLMNFYAQRPVLK